MIPSFFFKYIFKRKNTCNRLYFVGKGTTFEISRDKNIARKSIFILRLFQLSIVKYPTVSDSSSENLNFSKLFAVFDKNVLCCSAIWFQSKTFGNPNCKYLRRAISRQKQYRVIVSRVIPLKGVILEVVRNNLS